ncbi:hypothetical protein [Winogradskyella flava]|uniref:hypothetical protein n=1 Tax=Winogradskyella flava TaxID=1884876 RepID=UPI002490FE93|nr:hypothetical protein [Winogradskyella flava]
MEILFFLSVTCIIVFMLLATYDGAYLHLWKYELFNRSESLFEHKTHTARAILFPLIVWLLFIDTSVVGFCIGLAFVIIDLIVLGLDAYSEKESRSFMNGLPKWEYILHLFANSFHFAAIVLIIAARIKIEGNSIAYTTDFMTYPSFETVQLIAVNILPGAIILGIVHLLLTLDFGKKLWNINRIRITCC